MTSPGQSATLLIGTDDWAEERWLFVQGPSPGSAELLSPQGPHPGAVPSVLEHLLVDRLVAQAGVCVGGGGSRGGLGMLRESCHQGILLSGQSWYF